MFMVSLQENLYNKLFVTCAFNYFAFIQVLFEAIPLLCGSKDPVLLEFHHKQKKRQRFYFH